MVIKVLVPFKLKKHALGYYRDFEVDMSVRMLLVDVVENQTQTALSNKRVLLVIITVPAQGTVQCQRHYFSQGQGRLPTAPRPRASSPTTPEPKSGLWAIWAPAEPIPVAK